MTQSVNQFETSSEVGMLTDRPGKKLFSGIIDKNVSAQNLARLLPGSPVVITDTADEELTFDLATSESDNIFGFIPLEIKENTYKAGATIRVAHLGFVMIMETTGAIAKGGFVEIVPGATPKVAPVSSGTIIGTAFNKASGAGEKIKVYLRTL